LNGYCSGGLNDATVVEGDAERGGGDHAEHPSPPVLNRRCHFIPFFRSKMMNKLRLDLNALQVESFETAWLDSRVGTIHGAQDKLSAGENTQCGGVQTCGDGCNKVSGGGATQCGGVQTCGGGCPVSAGDLTQCGGVQTCGAGCPVTAGGATQCGGVQTCGAGCKG
jgi:hypothetical protein